MPHKTFKFTNVHYIFNTIPFTYKDAHKSLVVFCQGINYKKEKQSFMEISGNRGNTTASARDWTGNYRSVFVCNGASNHTKEKKTGR